MNTVFKYILTLIIATTMSFSVVAQSQDIRDKHKVKRKETIYSIARKYDITVKELTAANPILQQEGYQLRKGDLLYIPTKTLSTTEAVDTLHAAKLDKDYERDLYQGNTIKRDIQNREIRVGVMLPLNEETDYGRRMIEYYRGILMACDSLRTENISVDIRTWNVSEKSNIDSLLTTKEILSRDVIIGPPFTTQLENLVNYVEKYDIKLFAPFVMNKEPLRVVPNLFQAYQSDEGYCNNIVQRFTNKFDTCHTVIVNCGDTTGCRPLFAKELHKQLTNKQVSCSSVSLNASATAFRDAFDKTKDNIVVLNTSRSTDLNIAFAKLNTLIITDKQLRITLFGHTEWLMFVNKNLNNFYKYNTYIPSTFYMNPLSPRTARMNMKYRRYFHDDMMNALPRFAMTGFDHAYFFIKGLKMYGSEFSGRYTAVGYDPIQTPLNFKTEEDGHKTNQSVMFIRYTPSYDIETYTY